MLQSLNKTRTAINHILQPWSADYRQVRDDFSLLFNAQVPEFAEFANPGKSLEDYPAIVDRLIKVWTADTALDTIEDMLFRRGDSAAPELFDLEAFRDLLTLHAVAQAVRADSEQPSAAIGTSFPELDGTSLPDIDIDLSALVPLPRAGSPTPGRRSQAPAAKGAAPAGNLIDFDLSDYPIDKPSDRR